MKTSVKFITKVKRIIKNEHHFIDYFNSEEFYTKLCAAMWEDINDMPFYEGCPYPGIKKQFAEHIWHKRPDLFTYEGELYDFYYGIGDISIMDEKKHVVGRWPLSKNYKTNAIYVPEHEIAVYYNEKSKTSGIDVTPFFVRG